MIPFVVSTIVLVILLFRNRSVARERQELLETISCAFSAPCVLTAKEALEALIFMKKPASQSDNHWHLPEIPDETVKALARDASVDWLSRYWKILSDEIQRECPVLMGAMSYLREGERNTLSFNAEPLMEVILDSSVNFDSRTFHGMQGTIERFGVKRSTSRFISVSETFQCVLWLGSTKTSPTLAFDMEELMDKLEGSIRHAYQRVLLVGTSHNGVAESNTNAQFLQQVSHDIRAPLNNVKSILNVFRLEGIKPDENDLLEVALKNVDAMSDIVETILDYTSQSAGHLKVHVEEFSLNEFLTDILRSYEVTARMKGLKTAFFAEHSLVAKADPKHLRRVISNLISNAIKYTSHGTVNLTAREDGENVCIDVIDTGIGMTTSEQSDLFKPFSRFQRSLADGAGLGLVVSKHLIEANNGTISVSSKYGQGSIFTVMIQKGERAARYLEDEIAPQHKAVLIIDDDKDWRESLERSLSMHGYHVVAASNASEALGFLHLSEFDAVLTDCDMKGGGPEKFLPFLRAKQNPPRVLIISGKDPQKLSRLYSDCSILQKPVAMIAVTEWIEERDSIKLKSVA